jgi:TP901 family phage tail tape measure protein
VADNPIVLAVQAKDEATAIFAKIDGVLKGLGQSFQKTSADAEGGAENAASGFSKLTPALMGVGVAGAAVAAGAVLVGKHALDSAKEYQNAVVDMAASAGISVDAANKIGNALLDSAGKTVYSAQQQMEAIAPIAGQLQLVLGHTLTVSDANKIMAASMDLAEASGMDLNNAVKDTANVMQVYNIGANNAGEANSVLFQTARLTGQSVDAVASSVDRLKGRLGPLAPSLLDTSTFMADLTEHGVQGRMAMQAATAGMNTLLGGSKATNEELKKLNMTVFDSHGNFVGMSSVISQLSPKLANMTEQQRLAAEKTLFGSTAGRELDSTLMEGSAAYTKLAQTIGAHNAMQDAAAKRSQDLDHEEQQLGATVSDLWVMLGQNLIPVVQQFVGAITPVLTQVAQWIATHKQLATQILVVVGVVGALIAVAATLAIVIGLIASPVTLIIIGFALLAAGVIYLYGHWQGFHDLVNWTWNNVLKPVGAWIGMEAPLMWASLQRSIAQAGAQMSGFGTAVQTIWRDVQPIFAAIGNALGSIGRGIGGAASALHNLHVPGFAAGGIVSSPTLALIGEEGPEAVVPLSGTFSGGSGGLGGLGGSSTYVNIDMRGLTTYGERGMNDLLDALGTRLVQQILPNAGINIRR